MSLGLSQYLVYYISKYEDTRYVWSMDTLPSVAVNSNGHSKLFKVDL